MTTRGIRLNNPGNLRISTTLWQGKINPSQDPDFETFDLMEHGIRAIAKTLITYQGVHALRTIRELITRWAPPSDNNPTDAYVNNVADRSGFDPDARLDMTNPSDLEGVICGIIDQENGTMDGVTSEQISAGIQSALS
jgi:hypothetical protein